MLTGKPTEFIDFRHDKFKPKKFWDKLVACDENHYPASCSSVLPQTTMKLAKLFRCHAYSIMKVKNLEDGTRLIQLRNPHGKNSGISDWAGEETLWTTELMTEINSSASQIKSDHEEGVFWIQYEEFLKYFTRVYICIDDPKLNVKREVGFKIKSTEQNCFELTVKKKEKYYIKVYCDRARLTDDSDLSLILFDDTTPNRSMKDQSKSKNLLTSSIQTSLNPGQYTIVPLTFKDFFNRGLKKEEAKVYNLVIHSKEKIILKQTKSLDIYRSCIYNLCYHHSMTNSSFRNSNTDLHRIFKLISSKNGKAFILTSNPGYDVLLVAAFNQNGNQSLHVKLKVNPNKYKYTAVSKIDRRNIREENFEVVEKFTISSLGNHLNDNTLSLNHKVSPFLTEVLCIVHRYIENPILAFHRHCKKLSIDPEHYYIISPDIEKEDFTIELDKAEFL